MVSYVDGKRKLKWFAFQEDAREYAAIQNRDRDDYGSKIVLTTEQRFTLIQAEEIASRHPGATVLDGMRHYDAHLKELSKTVPFSVLASEIRAEYRRNFFVPHSLIRRSSLSSHSGFLPGFVVRP